MGKPYVFVYEGQGDQAVLQGLQEEVRQGPGQVHQEARRRPKGRQRMPSRPPRPTTTAPTNAIRLKHRNMNTKLVTVIVAAVGLAVAPALLAQGCCGGGAMKEGCSMGGMGGAAVTRATAASRGPHRHRASQAGLRSNQSSRSSTTTSRSREPWSRIRSRALSTAAPRWRRLSRPIRTQRPAREGRSKPGTRKGQRPGDRARRFQVAQRLPHRVHQGPESCDRHLPRRLLPDGQSKLAANRQDRHESLHGQVHAPLRPAQDLTPPAGAICPHHFRARRAVSPPGLPPAPGGSPARLVMRARGCIIILLGSVVNALL